jgi:hypothetical protein
MVKKRAFYTIKSSLWGKILSSILTGLFGSMLIVLFLTGLMPLGETVKYLPWILAFNASVAGYTLLDRTRDRLLYKKAAGVGVGFSVAALACTLLNILTLKMVGVGLMGRAEIGVFVSIAALFGGFGAWLAVRYTSIKNSQAN